MQQGDVIQHVNTRHDSPQTSHPSMLRHSLGSRIMMRMRSRSPSTRARRFQELQQEVLQNERQDEESLMMMENPYNSNHLSSQKQTHQQFYVRSSDSTGSKNGNKIEMSLSNDASSRPPMPSPGYD